MIRINLLPEVKRKAPKRAKAVARQIPYTWIIAGLAAVILAGVASLVIHLQLVERLNGLEREAVQVQAEIKKYKVQQGLVEKARSQRNALAQKLEIIATLKRRQTGPVRLLDELASTIPPRLWLTNISESNDSLTLTGFAVEHRQIAVLMENLQKSPIFQNVELVSSVAQEVSRGGRGGRGGVQGGGGDTGPVPVKAFELTCQISMPDETQ